MSNIDLSNVVTVLGQLATTLAVSGVIGVAITPVISYLKTFFGLNQEGKVLLKRILSAGTSIFGGVLTVYSLGQFLYKDLFSVILTSFFVFIASLMFYNNFWKDSEAIKKIEGTY